VSLLSGAPFIAGLSQVVGIDPVTGEGASIAQGLTVAIDVAPLSVDDAPAGFLTLEFNLNFPAPGPGRLLFVSEPNASPVILSGCLTTSSSMVLDRKSGRLVIAELATGRLVTLPLF
jgi:hypothetical protein